jgi:hypothetical protein
VVVAEEAVAPDVAAAAGRAGWVALQPLALAVTVSALAVGTGSPTSWASPVIGRSARSAVLRWSANDGCLSDVWRVPSGQMSSSRICDRCPLPGNRAAFPKWALLPGGPTARCQGGGHLYVWGGAIGCLTGSLGRIQWSRFASLRKGWSRFASLRKGWSRFASLHKGWGSVTVQVVLKVSVSRTTWAAGLAFVWAVFAQNTPEDGGLEQFMQGRDKCDRAGGRPGTC